MAELGYLQCPDCTKGTCRVSKNKRSFAFYYCDRCMTQHQTRSGEGSDGLLARMTPAASAPSPPATGEDPDEEEEPDMATKKGNDDKETKGDRRQSSDRRTSGARQPQSNRRQKEEPPQKTFAEEVFGDRGAESDDD